MAGRIIEDFRLGNTWLWLADAAIAVPTLVFYFAYASSTATLNTEEAIVSERSRQAGGRDASGTSKALVE